MIDEGLRRLVSLSSLESLDLSGARITDAGLRALAQLGSLHLRDLMRNKVPAVAIRGLKLRSLGYPNSAGPAQSIVPQPTTRSTLGRSQARNRSGSADYADIDVHSPRPSHS